MLELSLPPGTSPQQLAGSHEQIGPVFVYLSDQLPSGTEIVAEWVKPRFGNRVGWRVRSIPSLVRVMRGVVSNRCTELRFFAVAKDDRPNPNLTDQHLFE